MSDSARKADVVILTAIKLEYDQVLQVSAGAWPGSKWKREKKTPNGLPVSSRTFKARGGQPLRVVVAQAPEMGAVVATQVLAAMVAEYLPSCIAMCGVCAGYEQKTRLGDVIAADKLFFHDTGGGCGSH